VIYGFLWVENFVLSTKRFINSLSFLRIMVIVQDRSLRKPTGGRNKSTRPRRLAQSGSNPALTGIGKVRVKVSRVRGGNEKKKVLSTETVNLFDPKTKKYTKAKLNTVIESKSNRNYVRRNIITKGTVVDTDKGKAKVTNRPGQEGAINAVLQSE